MFSYASIKNNFKKIKISLPHFKISLMMITVSILVVLHDLFLSFKSILKVIIFFILNYFFYMFLDYFNILI